MAAAILFAAAGAVFTVGMVSVTDVPLAIDVYRGRTTLQVTYKDSIPTDTVVIFKTEVYGK